MNTKCMGNFVMLEPIKHVAETEGGLYLSEADKQQVGVEKAKIVSIGPMCTQELKIGDIAIYNQGHVDSVDVDGVIFRVIAEQFIILIQNEL